MSIMIARNARNCPRTVVSCKFWTNHLQNFFSVGGKVDGGNSGIFIKNVIDSSPAGRSAGLFTGDRILEVAGVSLTSSEQNVAVEAIKSSTSPIQFVVQSLQPAKVCHFVSNR